MRARTPFSDLPRAGGVPPFKAGVIAMVVIAVFAYFGFSKANPFAHPFELDAVFRTASNLAPGSPVRVAGIEVGTVTEVDPLPNGTTRVRLELEDRALPIHADAELKIRPRIFIGGNFFVDLHAGSPSAPELEDGTTVPLTRTHAPVQVGDVLADLEADTRRDLQVGLRELMKALDGAGAAGVREAVLSMEPAYRNLALAADATLGEQPGRDLRRSLSGTQRIASGLAGDQRALEGAVTSLGETAAALAGERAALAAAVPALDDLLRDGHPALGSLNGTLPSLRALAREAVPGVRRLAPTLAAAQPALRQARALMKPSELRGTARALKAELPRLVRLVDVSVPVFEQGRAASRCTARVLVPFIGSDLPDPDLPANTGTVAQKLMRSLVGLAGESRVSDGNHSYFHTSLAPEPLQVRPAPPPDPTVPPAHRPDVPCETQEPPNLEMPAATVTPGASGGEGLVPLAAGSPRTVAPAAAVQRRALVEARRLMQRHFLRLGRKSARLLRSGSWR